MASACVNVSDTKDQERILGTEADVFTQGKHDVNSRKS